MKQLSLRSSSSSPSSSPSFIRCTYVVSCDFSCHTATHGGRYELLPSVCIYRPCPSSKRPSPAWLINAHVHVHHQRDDPSHTAHGSWFAVNVVRPTATRYGDQRCAIMDIIKSRRKSADHARYSFVCGIRTRPSFRHPHHHHLRSMYCNLHIFKFAKPLVLSLAAAADERR